MYATIPIMKGAAVAENGVDLPFELLSDVTNHSAWRRFMAERIAMEIDYEAFGIRDVYLIGSTESGDAGIGSDIDLILYVDETRFRRHEAMSWLDGWSRSLALMNYMRTGYMTDGLLDIHLVTDRGIREQDSYATLMKNAAASSRLTSRS